MSILHKTNLKKEYIIIYIIIQRYQPCENYVNLYTQYLVWAPFAWITTSVQRGLEAQVALLMAFSSSVLLGLMSLSFLLTTHLIWPTQVDKTLSHDIVIVLRCPLFMYTKTCLCAVDKHAYTTHTLCIWFKRIYFILFHCAMTKQQVAIVSFKTQPVCHSPSVRRLISDSGVYKETLNAAFGFKPTCLFP